MSLSTHLICQGNILGSISEGEKPIGILKMKTIRLGGHYGIDEFDGCCAISRGVKNVDEWKDIYRFKDSFYQRYNI